MHHLMICFSKGFTANMILVDLLQSVLTSNPSESQYSHTVSLKDDRGLFSRIAFVDISKAFDRVIHSGLICKLEHSGIDGSLLNRLSYYLGGRSQIARINDSFSNACYTNCGIPQGSVLGPLLFLIYVNDIAESIESSISLFADDTALLFSSRCPLHLYQVLTRDLHTLSD